MRGARVCRGYAYQQSRTPPAKHQTRTHTHTHTHTRCQTHKTRKTQPTHTHPRARRPRRASEAFLQQVVALLVASHYKNTPNDLLLLADAPAHQLYVLLAPVDEAQVGWIKIEMN